MIAGDGPDREALAAQANGLAVELRGFVEDVPAFHGELAAFCLPSRWEGLPFALLEAMMSGLPCVASDVGDVRVALDGAGLVVPPEDRDRAGRRARGARRRLRSGVNWAPRLTQRAVERYGVEKMVAETVEVYDGALSQVSSVTLHSVAGPGHVTEAATLVATHRALVGPFERIVHRVSAPSEVVEEAAAGLA